LARQQIAEGQISTLTAEEIKAEASRRRELKHSQMLRLIRSLQSVEDEIAIWQHVAIHNGIAADRLIDRFDERINSLMQSPEIGERQLQFGEHTRRLIVGNYLIFYDVLPNVIHVLRIFHAARSIESLSD